MNVLHTPAALRWTPFKVAWLSGASDPWSCALSPTQRRLLAELDVPEDHVCPVNFPYRGAERARQVPLPLAALSNGAQFALASTPLWRLLAGRHWASLCASTARLFVIAGSTGAQFLRTFERSTPPGVEVAAVALGPVAWGPPRGLELAIVGRDDAVARPFVGRLGCRTALVDGVRHMGYLDSAEVRDQVRAWLAAKLPALHRT